MGSSFWEKGIAWSLRGRPPGFPDWPGFQRLCSGGLPYPPPLVAEGCERLVERFSRVFPLLFLERATVLTQLFSDDQGVAKAHLGFPLAERFPGRSTDRLDSGVLARTP